MWSWNYPKSFLSRVSLEIIVSLYATMVNVKPSNQINTLKNRKLKLSSLKEYFCEDHLEENSGEVWYNLKAIWGRSSVLKCLFPYGPVSLKMEKKWYKIGNSKFHKFKRALFVVCEEEISGELNWIKRVLSILKCALYCQHCQLQLSTAIMAFSEIFF